MPRRRHPRWAAGPARRRWPARPAPAFPAVEPGVDRATVHPQRLRKGRHAVRLVSTDSRRCPVDYTLKDLED